MKCPALSALLLSALLLALTSCGIATPSPAASDFAPSPSPAASELPVPTEEDFTDMESYPPTSAMFNLEGLDAALYDAVVDETVKRFVVGAHLRLPTISLVDSYPSEDAYPSGDIGGTCYVVYVNMFVLHDIGHTKDWDDPVVDIGEVASYCRLTLMEDEDGTLRCTDAYNLQDNLENRDKLGGSSEDVKRAIRSGTSGVVTRPVEGLVEIRDITPTTGEELLDAYLDYYFR